MTRHPSPVNQKKSTIIESFLIYLSNTKPYILIFHLMWILISSSVLSVTYIIAFHFTSIISLYQEAHDVAHFNKNLMLSAEKDKVIEDDLTKLLTDANADRTYVFRYHNGLAAVSGVPFFFQTNTHEVIRPGTSRVLSFHQRIPVSVNMTTTNELIQNKCAVVLGADLNQTNQNYWYYQTRNAKNLIRCPIFVNSGDILGFVGADYTGDIDISKIDAYVASVKDVATKISEIYAPKK